MVTALLVFLNQQFNLEKLLSSPSHLLFQPPHWKRLSKFQLTCKQQKVHGDIEFQAETSMVFKLQVHLALCCVKMLPAAQLKCPIESRKRQQPFCTTNKRYIIHSKLSSEILCSLTKAIIHILTQRHLTCGDQSYMRELVINRD